MTTQNQPQTKLKQYYKQIKHKFINHKHQNTSKITTQTANKQNYMHKQFNPQQQNQNTYKSKTQNNKPKTIKLTHQKQQSKQI